jgi:hypothetical protein
MVYGTVRDLGELLCPCFTLFEDDALLLVWYDLMVAEDGKTRPPVSVEDIDNGDEVVVTGELRRPGTETAVHNFWVSSIVKAD